MRHEVSSTKPSSLRSQSPHRGYQRDEHGPRRDGTLDHSSAPGAKPAWTFFALVFLLAIPFWVLGGFVGGVKGTPMGLPASALQFVCPVVAAVVLVYRQGGVAGVADLLKRTVRPPVGVPKPWYLVSLGLVPTALLLSYWVLRLAGLSLTGPVSPVWAAPALLLVFLIAAACEEAGWMGYAVDPLRRRWGTLSTGVILGAVWGVFHLVPLLEAHRTPAWIAGWFLGTVAARVLIVWLYSNTRKAILPGVLFHTMLNVGGSFFPNYSDEAQTQIAFGIALGLAAVVAVVVWGPKTLPRCS